MKVRCNIYYFKPSGYYYTTEDDCELEVEDERHTDLDVAFLALVERDGRAPGLHHDGTIFHRIIVPVDPNSPFMPAMLRTASE